MKTKNILITFAIIIASFSKAQIKVYVNDKEINEGNVINLKDIKTIKLMFKPVSKVNTSNNGIARVNIGHFRKDGEDVSVNYAIYANGMNACESLINNNGKTFNVANSENNNSDFEGRELYKYWQSLSAFSDMQPVTIKITVVYRDKIGYEKYGTPIDLVTPFSFKLNPVDEMGYINIPLLNAKLSKTNAELLKFKFVEMRMSGPTQDAVFINPSKTIAFDKEGFNGTFMRAFTVEAKNKTQEEYMNEILNSFEDELISSSKISLPTNGSNTKQWKSFFRSLKSDKIGKFKKVNKSELHEPVALGQLIGFKVNYKFNEFHSSIYILAHPKEKNQIVVFYSDHLNVPSTEDFNSSIVYLESFLKSIEFK